MTRSTAYVLLSLVLGMPTPALAAPLTLSKDAAPTSPNVGQSVTYTLEASNVGVSSVADVTLVDALPPTMSFQSASSSGGSCSELAGVVTCPLGTLGPGGSGSATIVATALAGGTIVNTASVSAPSVAPPVLFGEEVTLTPGSILDTNATRFADLDGDGADDAVAMQPTAATVTVHLNTGDGTFAPAVTYPVAGAPNLPRALVVADLTNDGHPDVATLNDGNTATVRVNDGAGGFTTRHDSPASAAPATLGVQLGAAADVTGDAIPDLVEPLVRFTSGGEILLYPGLGGGAFGAAVAVPAGLLSGASSSNAVAFHTGDMNGDTLSDVVTTYREFIGSSNLPYFSSVLVVLGNGDGTFDAALPGYGIPGYALGTRLVDEDADGALDVATFVTFFDCAFDADLPCAPADARWISKIAVAHGDGDGTFAPLLHSPIDADVLDGSFGDLDGDGDLDAAFTVYGQYLATRLGHEDGLYDGEVQYPGAWGFQRPAVADFDADSSPDLAFVRDDVGFGLLHGSAGTFTVEPDLVMPRQSRALAVGDLDGDDHVDVASGARAEGGALTTTLLLGDGTGGFPIRHEIAARDVVTTLATAAPAGTTELHVADWSAFPNKGIVELAGRQHGYYKGVPNDRLQLVFFTTGGTIPAGTEVRLVVPVVDIAIGDLDGDGLADLVTWYDYQVDGLVNAHYCGLVARFGTGNAAVVGPAELLIDGDPVTNPLFTCPSIERGSVFELADMDLDGALDAVFSQRIYFGDGSGAFPTSVAYASAPDWSFVVADVERDGDPDVVRIEFDPMIRVYLNDGTGSPVLQPGSGPAENPVLTDGTAVGDLDRDGDLDVVTTRSNGGSVVSSYLASPGFAFTHVADVPGVTSPGAVRLADLDGDGLLDLVAATLDGKNRVSLLRGNGDGTFAPPVAFRTGDLSFAAAVADLDEDGTPDLVVSNERSISSSHPGTYDDCVASDPRAACRHTISVRLGRATNFAAAAVSVPRPTRTPTPTATVSATPTTTTTATATASPTATLTPTVTVTRTPTPTLTATPTATPTETPPPATATPTATPTPSTPVCAPAPVGGCTVPLFPQKSSLALKDSVDEKDQLTWKMSGLPGTSLFSFGDPVSLDGYTLCLYDGTGLLATLEMPPGGLCAGKPCWKAGATAYKYKDKDATPAGITSAQLKSGIFNGQPKIQVKGKGVHLPMPALGAALVSPVTVQLHGAERCWETVHSAPFAKNDGVSFKDKDD